MDGHPSGSLADSGLGLGVQPAETLPPASVPEILRARSLSPLLSSGGGGFCLGRSGPRLQCLEEGLRHGECPINFCGMSG